MIRVGPSGEAADRNNLRSWPSGFRLIQARELFREPIERGGLSARTHRRRCFQLACNFRRGRRGRNLEKNRQTEKTADTAHRGFSGEGLAASCRE